jgi:hypothetical protein
MIEIVALPDGELPLNIECDNPTRILTVGDQACRIAESHHVAVEQVFVSAFADQFATWQRLRERAARGDREKFLAFSIRSRTSNLKSTIVFEVQGADQAEALWLQRAVF